MLLIRIRELGLLASDAIGFKLLQYSFAGSALGNQDRKRAKILGFVFYVFIFPFVERSWKQI
jgi:hypothetical protein